MTMTRPVVSDLNCYRSASCEETICCWLPRRGSAKRRHGSATRWFQVENAEMVSLVVGMRVLSGQEPSRLPKVSSHFLDLH